VRQYGQVLDLLEQTRVALEAGAFMPALMTTLTVPDICGALGSSNGRASGSKYCSWLVAWFELNAGTTFAQAMDSNEAADLYAFRCSLLHQGSARPDGGGTRIAFVEPRPDTPILHNFYTQVGSDVVFCISIPDFVDEMTDAATRWWLAYGQTKTVARNFERYARRRVGGLPLFNVSSPVVA
jgi:hypothetical protein